MKYMGSKRAMLQHGLGDILVEKGQSAARFIDLFSGGGSVSWFAATNLQKPVLACDLQEYAAVLAGSVTKRTRPVEALEIERIWLSRALRARQKLEGWHEAKMLDTAMMCTESWQEKAQELCMSGTPSNSSLIWRCYGGHYFSPTQALSFDAMVQSVPKRSELRELCLAATIVAASQCAAAPGHTAQPFKATPTGARFFEKLGCAIPSTMLGRPCRSYVLFMPWLKGMRSLPMLTVWPGN